jgi:competence protein ComEA
VEPGPTPWRALEDTGQKAAAAAEVPSQGGVPRSAVLAGGGAILLAVIAFVLALGSGSGGSVVVDSSTPLAIGASSGDSGAPSSGGLVDPTEPLLVVEVVGAIHRPGVYRLPGGARVADLIETAGGYGPRVDTSRAERELNLAAPLRDGDQVRVPSRDDPSAALAPPVAGSGQGGGGSGPVNLNQASASELDALPGIGPVTAAKIIASREEQPFATVEDLRTRKLVGEKTFANLKALVTVR